MALRIYVSFLRWAMRRLRRLLERAVSKRIAIVSYPLGATLIVRQRQSSSQPTTPLSSSATPPRSLSSGQTSGGLEMSWHEKVQKNLSTLNSESGKMKGDQ